MKRSTITGDTAVALIAANRPGYFKETVDALAMNPEISSAAVPVYCFVDKNPESPRLQAAHVDTLLEAIPHATPVLRESTYGCARQIIDARVQLFGEGYERLFVFEDDLTVDPTYIAYCLQLWSWSRDLYDNVGFVSGWVECHGDVAAKLPAASVVRWHARLWGYLMGRDAWRSVEPSMLEYQMRFKPDGDRKSQETNRLIRTWFAEKRAAGQFERGSPSWTYFELSASCPRLT